jgi:hypothetical protein
VAAGCSCSDRTNSGGSALSDAASSCTLLCASPMDLGNEEAAGLVSCSCTHNGGQEAAAPSSRNICMVTDCVCVVVTCEFHAVALMSVTVRDCEYGWHGSLGAGKV